MDVQKRRIRLFVIVAAVIALSITAEKCRELIGEEGSSQSGKFTLLNCFDMGSGTMACAVKEGVKLYFYSIRSTHVEKARQRAIESALADAVSQGMSPTDSAKHAQKESKKAAKLASRQAKRIIGPVISSGWDFFEAIYYGGTLTEGFLRGTGTLFGAYGGGYLGEQSLGRIGYLVGSHMGSWVGGRIGLMIYDVVNGVHLLLQFVQTGEIEVHKTPATENFDAPDTSFDGEVPDFESSESAGLYESPTSESSSYESPRPESSSLYESAPSKESNAYESTEYQDYESYENSEL